METQERLGQAGVDVVPGGPVGTHLSRSHENNVEVGTS